MSGDNGQGQMVAAVAEDADLEDVVEDEGVDLGEYSDSEIASASAQEDRESAAPTADLIAEVTKDLDGRQQEENAGSASTADSVDDVFKSREDAIRVHLAQEMKELRARKELEIDAKQEELNRSPLRRALDPLARVVGYSTMVDLKKEKEKISEDWLLETVLQSYLTECRQTIAEQEKDLEYTRQVKQGYENEVARCKTYMKRNCMHESNANAKQKQLTDQIAELTNSLKALAPKKLAGKATEAELKCYKMAIAKKEKKENEFDELEKLKNKVYRNVQQVHKKLENSSKQLGQQKDQEAMIEERLDDIRQMYTTLKQYKGKEEEQRRTIEIYKRWQKSGQLFEKGNKVAGEYQRGIGALISMWKNQQPSKGAEMAPELEAAINKEKSGNQHGRELLDMYRVALNQ